MLDIEPELALAGAVPVGECVLGVVLADELFMGVEEAVECGPVGACQLLNDLL